jgi:succinate dehydrogenase flavin-adding protein (antitoxin of CptAB toxin-antitoxin module)
LHFTKLTWQCRRGTQELDRFLIGYLENYYLQAASTEQRHFQQLLSLEDNELLHLFLTEDGANQHGFYYLIEKIRHSAAF